MAVTFKKIIHDGRLAALDDVSATEWRSTPDLKRYADDLLHSMMSVLPNGGEHAAAT